MNAKRLLSYRFECTVRNFPSKRKHYGLVASLLFFFSAGFPPATAADLRFIDFASVSWEGARPSSFNLESVKDVVEFDVSPRWKRYTSSEGGTLNQSVDFQVGQILDLPIELPNFRICENQDSLNLMSRVRKEFYEKVTLTSESERYLVIVTPDAGCIWSGKGSIGELGKKGGTIILHNTNSALVLAHELGHNLGLGHSNFLRCNSGKRDGPWGNDCKAIEYGGTVDIMGNVDVDSPLSTYHQWRLGLISSREIRQSWKSESIDLVASDVAQGTRAIFIRDGRTTYWMEFRRASFFNSYKSGLVIFRTDPPPVSSIVSPNPEDSQVVENGDGALADIWMLNLDDYTYSRSQASGSMSLPIGTSFQFYSGNISVTTKIIDSTGNSIRVSISRRSDTTPPAKPELSDSYTWKYADAELIKPGYEDADSQIQNFELNVEGKIVEVEGSPSKSGRITYLNPFSSPKTLFVSDLPEGKYSFSVRGVDVWGNKSDWSREQEVLVDRSLPLIGAEVMVQQIEGQSVRISLPAIKDRGSGICSTDLINRDGFILQSSKKKSDPEIRLNSNRDFKAELHVYDCIGNGLRGDFEAKTTIVSASQSSKTGKWGNSTSIAGAMKCNSKCSASFSMVGIVHVLLAEGVAEIKVNGKKVQNGTGYLSDNLRTAAVLNLGSKRSIVRVSGSKFTLIGIASINLSISNVRESPALAPVVDVSLDDPIQKRLSNFGLTSDDFSHGWAVLPMARGTTLEDPTLDLCNSSYKSELGREFRRQVTIFRANMPFVFLSSEVVKYKTQTHALAALEELKSTYTVCKENGGGFEKNSIFTDYSFYSIPKFETLLVSEGSRLIVRSQIGSGDSARHLFGVYQFQGEMFSGLYIVKSGEQTFSDDEIIRWLEAAGVIAERLKGKF